VSQVVADRTGPGVSPDHYLFTDDHALLRESVRDWVRARVAPHIDEWERAGAFPREIFEELGRLGHLGLQYPVEYGGQGGDFVANVILCEELSRAGAEAVSTAVGVHTAMATSPILKFGTEAQRTAYLPDLLAGRKIAALAITEPGGGSDVAGITTRARRADDDGWVLRGAKTFVTNGARADVILTVARTDEAEGHDSFSLFLVDGDLPGIVRGRPLEKLGRHASDTCEVTFEDVRLPASALLGQVGGGFRQIMWELVAERLVSAATSVALGYHALDLALEHIRNRRQFSTRIADFQAVRHTLADLATELAAARELTYFAIWRFQRGDDRVVETSMAKLAAAEAVNKMADYALQLHGGYGYMSEYPISRVWVDARVKRITAGTDEIQREIIARRVVGRTNPTGD
jgi:alkylation response protein AidB-like acyl-CoA dehydrogenase